MENTSPLAARAAIMGSGTIKIVKALVDASADVNQPLRRAEYSSLVAAATAAAAGEEKIDICGSVS